MGRLVMLGTILCIATATNQGRAAMQTGSFIHFLSHLGIRMPSSKDPQRANPAGSTVSAQALNTTRLNNSAAHLIA
jgi:hypothetical protein